MVYISETLGMIMLKFRICGNDISWHFNNKNQLFLLKCHGATIHIPENCIIVLPINNSRMWHAGFLGCTTHYCVS